MIQLDYRATFFVVQRSEPVEQVLQAQWWRFGKWIVAKREALGWTQTRLAEELGMRYQQIGRIEAGASTKRATVIRIADGLKASREEALKMAGFDLLAPGEDLALSSDARLQVIIAKFESLPPDEQASFEPILEMVNSELDRRLRQAAPTHKVKKNGHEHD